MHYLLFYDVVDGYGERRQPFRAGHLERARQAVARGELMLGGALGSPGTFYELRGQGLDVRDKYTTGTIFTGRIA